MKLKNDIVVNLILCSLFVASLFGKIAISPGAILACITAIYCVSKLAFSIENQKKQSDTIHVHVPLDKQVISNSQFVEEPEKMRMDGEILAQIHSRRMKDSLGQSNINNQEHESDGQQTMNSLKVLQGIKDATD